jgi:hypothetical protein
MWSCLGWPRTSVLQISASQVARITDWFLAADMIFESGRKKSKAKMAALETYK